MEVREAYIEKVSAQLAEWQDWIERYKIDAASHRLGRPADTSRLLERLDNSYQSAYFSLEALHHSTESNWETAKEDVERSMIALKLALDESGAVRAGQSLALHSSRAHAFAPFPRKERS